MYFSHSIIRPDLIPHMNRWSARRNRSARSKGRSVAEASPRTPVHLICNRIPRASKAVACISHSRDLIESADQIDADYIKDHLHLQDQITCTEALDDGFLGCSASVENQVTNQVLVGGGDGLFMPAASSSSPSIGDHPLSAGCFEAEILALFAAVTTGRTTAITATAIEVQPDVGSKRASS